MEQGTLWDGAPPRGGKVLTCHNCGDDYVRVKGATGTKYCSRPCAAVAQRKQSDQWTVRNVVTPPPLRYRCGACGDDYPVVLGTTHHRGLYLCADCTTRVRPVMHRLRNHHVGLDLIHDVASGRTSRCPIDGRDLMTPVVTPGGKVRIPMVVDHDHRCCPGATSCGGCVRGLICMWCNLAMGLMGEDPAAAWGMILYLQTTRSEAFSSSGVGP